MVYLKVWQYSWQMPRAGCVNLPQSSSSCRKPDTETACFILIIDRILYAKLNFGQVRFNPTSKKLLFCPVKLTSISVRNTSIFIMHLDKFLYQIKHDRDVKKIILTIILRREIYPAYQTYPAFRVTGWDDSLQL